MGRGFQDSLCPFAPITVKILHIIHSANPANGGPIEGVKQLAAAFIQLGSEVEVISLDAPDAPWRVSKKERKLAEGYTAR